jgi:hypothetical protein
LKGERVDWKQRFERATEEFQSDLREVARNDYDLLAQATVKLIDLPSVMNQDAILHCIREFAQAELDVETPGDRGLGRLSTEVPRFGAYFRNPLVRLSPEDIDSLRQRIVAQLVAGSLLSGRRVAEPLVRSWEERHLGGVLV